MGIGWWCEAEEEEWGWAGVSACRLDAMFAREPRRLLGSECAAVDEAAVPPAPLPVPVPIPVPVPLPLPLPLPLPTSAGCLVGLELRDFLPGQPNEW